MLVFFQKYKKKPPLATKTNEIVISLGCSRILDRIPFFPAITISTSNFKLIDFLASIIHPVDFAKVKEKIRIWQLHKLQVFAIKPAKSYSTGFQVVRLNVTTIIYKTFSIPQTKFNKNCITL